MNEDGPTVTTTCVVTVCPPPVPVMATVYSPRLAEFDAVSVRMLEEVGEFATKVAGFGEKDAVTPLGRAEATSVTGLLKPL